MRIGYLELRNYRKFRELRLEFPDGVIGILGPNGVGKTTIIESIAWALFGNVEEVVRTSREGVRRSDAGSGDVCSSLVEFDLGGEQYQIERAMSGKSLSMKAELRSGGKVLAESDRAVRKAVEKLLGMDHKSFFTSVFARQKELNALQNVAPGERKKAVLRMLRIDGIDDALQELRADKRDSQERIKGAERTLLTDDGREKEKVILEGLPGIEKAAAETSEKLVKSEEKERKARENLEEARKLRDSLKKDVDAYNASLVQLKEKQTSLDQLRKAAERVQGRMREIELLLNSLPELERAEGRFLDTSKLRERLEGLRGRSEKERMLKKSLESLAAREAECSSRLATLKAQVTEPTELQAQREQAEKLRAECASAKATLSESLGEIRSKKTAATESVEKDTKKLKEIEGAGAEGLCPTCERVLGDSYGLLVDKLQESVRNARTVARECDEKVSALSAELEGLSRKEEAVGKKMARLEQDLTKLKQLETAVEGAEESLRVTKAEVQERTKELADLGKVEFSEEEYRKVKVDHERLRELHEEFVRLKEQEKEHTRKKRELDETMASIRTTELQANSVRDVVVRLEPKKEKYEIALKEFDEKAELLSEAKDELKTATVERNRSASELEKAKQDLESIARVKKEIEKDRMTAGDLAVLENVMVSFKNHLISKVAPTLSELTSHMVDAMTDGRYGRVELSEDYEIQIDDQGELYPISRFSGGESDLANLGLRLAISRVIAERAGTNPMNLLILDEIFGSQDVERKRNVMSTLSNLSAQFRQIFLITHVEEIKDLIGQVIRVETLPDGTSTASVAA